MSVMELPPTPTATAPASRPGAAGRAAGAPRRSELAAFLRARRARVSPEDVGMAPGLRRRTPGLRREEVAQLAGVGVTWYTWLEQGRPINASEQVLAAVARTLKLDAAEQAHLFHLAGLPASLVPPDTCPISPEMQVILDALSPLPAAVSNARYDVLRWNDAYAALFPGLTRPDAPLRNTLWASVTVPDCCNAFVNCAEQLPLMVAVLRSGYGQHVGEPYWEEFIRDLRAVSPTFARLWAQGDVAAISTRTKLFRHAGVGELRMSATNLSAPGMPEARIVIYTPQDEQSREAMARLLAEPDLPTGCVCDVHAAAD